MARGSTSSQGRSHGKSQPFSSASFSSGPPSKAAIKSSVVKGKRKAANSFAEDVAVERSKRRKDASEADDVYVFSETAMKRSRSDAARLALSRDESALAFGRTGDVSESEDESGGSDSAMAFKIRQAAIKIAGEDGFDLEDDESEVDSDAAWDDEGNDEDRWGGVFKSLGKRDSRRQIGERVQKTVPEPAPDITLEVDLTESDDEEDLPPSPHHSISSTFKPNLSAFSSTPQGVHQDSTPSEEFEEEDEEDESDEDLMPAGRLASESKHGAGSGGQNDDDDDDDDDESDGNQSMADPEMPSDLDSDSGAEEGLLDFVSALPGASKRKSERVDEYRDETVEEATARKKRRVLASEAGPGGREDGGAYSLPSAQKLSLSSLLSSESSFKPAAAALLKPTAQANASSKSVLKRGVLHAPLPTVVTERMAREAAYEATKAEGDKWGGVMKRVKEAEYLRFPLQPGGLGAGPGASQGKERRRGGVKSAGEIVGTFQPVNEMESAVTALLMSANLKEAQISKSEDSALASQDLSTEDIAARRSELRHQRELLFRAEIKAKRVAKIKSKTFRKLARKRVERTGGGVMDLEELKRLDPAKAAEEVLKMEAMRAKERATLKHSAKGGKWAKQLYGSGDTEGQRRELEEMLQRKEMLRRKIKGLDSDDDDSVGDDDHDTDSDELEDDIKQNAFDQLASMAKRSAGLDEESKQSGLMSMKFMQRAAAKERAIADIEEMELRKQLEAYEEGGEQNEDEHSSSGSDNGDSFERSGKSSGRMSFAPAAISRTVAADKRSMMLPPSTAGGNPTMTQEGASTEIDDDDSNPWLDTAANSTSRSRKKNMAVAGKDAATADRAVQSLKKQQRLKSSSAKDGAAEDARIDIETKLDGLLKKPRGSPGPLPLALEEVSDDEDGEGTDFVTKGPQAFQQRDLVAQAFAGDNVVEDFAAEKRRAIAADAPKEEDLTLPGWGSWGGKGVKKHKNARKFVQISPGIPAAQRKDFERTNVIISEKKDKKAAKYLSTDLPYPYTSAAQYEASFGAAVGADWNTRTTHQRSTMPRVTKKPGVIIDPISRLF